MMQYIPRLLTDIVSNDSASIIQLIYETLLLTWLLSFEYEGIVQLVRHRIIPQLHRVLQRVQKEKCVRVALMALWNMVEAERKYVQHQLNPNFTEWVDPGITVLAKLQERHDGAGGAHGAPIHGRRGPSLVAEMVSVGMIKTLNQLQRRKFGDEDILVLVEDLNRALEQNMEVLTSFSEYRGEVLSSYLEWTPVHTSAKFWKENAQKFEENNYEVLSVLGKLILETKSDVTLAVACHDLGEVVRYHPTGRNLLSLACLAGVKERVMTLMSHPHAEISKEALLCTQKIMVQRWEFIQS
ncbi:V-type H+-transporting ATPase 54 kD subunit [Strigomonas culicis]|uniref:V-type H+-transporting ATPase 54 kD subunit n=1 Tax=Strigomonas culicis TaxID=28005 RepID=S9V6R7_9TRYP|nr:V-type H+-transporting ATPase 54 kD subunit [Strigomonas culicis]|eukprot:EPY36528.1 V-type H+-transporting ATPase 54 kD subunit [Strigomonas culicis]